jgi:hypothetical protein
MIYFPQGGDGQLNLSALNGKKLTVWWYDPRTGNAIPDGKLKRSEKLTVSTPTRGKGHDWILVLDGEKMLPPGTFSLK